MRKAAQVGVIGMAAVTGQPSKAVIRSLGGRTRLPQVFPAWLALRPGRVGRALFLWRSRQGRGSAASGEPVANRRSTRRSASAGKPRERSGTQEMANEYKKTMNLPDTKFPMRASLAQREPERLKVWRENNVYEMARKKNAGHEKFVLHDGPPYANGPIHLGHALNKISKDIINRFWSMRGYDTPYVPGWDCHGQPIEHKVEEKVGTAKFNEMPTAKIREMCNKFAVENIELQKAGFRRLGVLADWDNPYLTLYHQHDAADIEVFKAMFDKGMVYRGRKPVHWCKHCHTALAEAEIEYADEVSPAIFVRFEMTTLPAGLEAWAGKLWVDIWTTTPWTLPADDAVILHPEAIYVALVHNGQAEIVAEALKDRLVEKFGYGEAELVRGEDGEPWRMTGEQLAHNKYKQPIFGDQGVEGEFIYADYVTLDDGTGIVHSAPGHGVDDYLAGQKFGIEVVMPVDDDGRFFEGEGMGTGGPFSGMDTDEANPKIIEWLRERGTLILHEDINHSYPHCWRCKNPVLFRATDQWFVSMDKTCLRTEALDAINNHVTWYPERASKRIGAMVEGRPDWCISRQRNWGVPIPSYTCEDCGETVMNGATLDAVIKLFHEKGSDAWFTDEPASYLGEACTCTKCGGHNLRANRDILDVWWDSGVSWKAVCEFRDELEYPADVYLEGSDQHRGWFQSSLLTSVGANGHAPYKAVISQGFTLDGQGRKMSKSLGNVIDPNKICDEMGADIIRLWVASVDTSKDMACDHEILARTSDAYRRFRNTYRFLLGELEGQFDPESDLVPVEELETYDKLVLARACEMHETITDAFEHYRFYQVYRSLYDFVVTELSNGYLNATKDRMYCGGVDSHERRSAQTCWYYLLQMLVRDMQPILAFTTDEVLAHLPASARDGQEFAALLNWWEAPLAHSEVGGLLATYHAMLEARGVYTKAYEEALAAGVVTEKTSQATRCELSVTAEGMGLLAGCEELLAEAFVCSGVTLVAGEELSAKVVPAEGEKCPRCWNWRELGSDGLCCRCHEAVAAKGEQE